MRKITMHVVAVLILTCAGVWMASATEPGDQTRSLARGIDPSKTMINAPRLPTEWYTDYFGD